MSDSVMLVRVDQASALINDSIKYPFNGGTALSFNRTYHERIHGVIRPRLNETCMDPEMLRGLNDLETSQ